ncbi:MAG TPA: L-ribulose-5-phosphate 4-epimerase, partial [Lachnoclostridium sp.]|nr:L-ribulose-5-phosphate 4-epimerase [Lachnoclostridium sp.]
MKTYTLGLHEKSMPAELSWKEKLEAAKSTGF